MKQEATQPRRSRTGILAIHGGEHVNSLWHTVRQFSVGYSSAASDAGEPSSDGWRASVRSLII